MIEKTMLIVGKAGPQGKTTLAKKLKDKFKYVIEIEDLVRGGTKVLDALNYGSEYGFVVENFSDIPFFTNEQMNLWRKNNKEAK